jgi:hypothetical protein
MQRILMTRLLRVTSVGVLSFIALLTWMAASPSAQRGHAVGESTAVASGVSTGLTPVVTADRNLTNRTAAQSARVVVRRLLVGRARASDGDGETTLTFPFLSSPAPSFGDVAESARACLRRLAQSHPPYGEPSPFDATAPPAANRRNG